MCWPRSPCYRIARDVRLRCFTSKGFFSKRDPWMIPFTPMDKHFPSFPILVGLQKPLEFKGIRGRFLGWMAGIVGIAMMGTLILLTMTNFLIAMLFLLVVVTIGYLIIKTKQKQGLHNKKICRDCLIYHNLFMIKR